LTPPETADRDARRGILERGFVWAGGAMFVGSLTYCAFSYLVSWSSGEPGGGWRAVAADGLLITIFAVHHSVLARDSVKRSLARHLPDRLLRSVYVWTAAALLIVACAAWQPVGGERYRSGGVLQWLHAVVQLTGVWLIARAVRTIDPLELAGIRVDRLTARPESPAAAERLQVVGPYRLVRHPLYLGWLLLVGGAAHMTGDRLTFAALTMAYLMVAIPWEERSLIAEFGAEYERYRARVRWRVVPFLY
jgi:protein-S-isoprenylcysteine O-methyltransferase Ste14